MTAVREAAAARLTPLERRQTTNSVEKLASRDEESQLPKFDLIERPLERYARR